MEENTMAILDASGVKDTQDANDDSWFTSFPAKIWYLKSFSFYPVSEFLSSGVSLFLLIIEVMAFLEAVRLSSLVPENGTAPTRYAEYGFKSISLSIFVFW